MAQTYDTELNPKHYRLYRYRYLVAFVYFIINLLGSFMGNQFLAIQTTLDNIYSSSTYLINFTTTLTNYIANIPVIFLGNFVVDKYGIKISVYISAFLILIALWVRCISDSSIYAILAGQTLGSMAVAFISAPQKVSVNWFHSSERALWTTIMIQGLNMGTGLGTEISGFAVEENAGPDEGRTQVFNFMLYTAIVGTTICIFSCIFMKEKPPLPPSPAADHEKQPFLYSVKILFSTWENFLAILGASLFLGGVIGFVSTFQIIVNPLGVKNKDIGTSFLIANIPGFFGAIFISGYAAKTNQIKKVLFGTGMMTSLSLFLMYFASKSNSLVFLVLSVSIFAFFLQPILPMLLELLCEIAYPAGEAVSAGMLFIVGNIFGVGASFLIDWIMSDKNPDESIVAFLIMVGMIMFGMISVFISKAKLERTLDENKSLLRENEISIDNRSR